MKFLISLPTICKLSLVSCAAPFQKGKLAAQSALEPKKCLQGAINMTVQASMHLELARAENFMATSPKKIEFPFQSQVCHFGAKKLCFFSVEM